MVGLDDSGLFQSIFISLHRDFGTDILRDATLFNNCLAPSTFCSKSLSFLFLNPGIL